MKFLTRKIIVLSFISFFTDFASEMLYPVIPLYLKTLGFSVFFIGILEGLAEFLAGVSKGYFGQLSDQLKKRVIFVRTGYSLSAIAKPLMGLLPYPVLIFFARALDRLGKGIRTSARDALLSDETSPQNKGKVFGFHRSLDTAGAVIGPLIALIYLHFFPHNYRNLFIYSLFPGLFAIILTLFIKDKFQFRTFPEHKTKFFGFVSFFSRSPLIYKKVTIPLIIFMLFNSSDFFLLLKLKEKQINDSHVIWFYILFNVSYAFFSFPIGKIADRVGLKKTLSFGLLSFSLVYFLINFTDQKLYLILIFLMYGLYYSATEGISKALITNLVTKEDTATALGAFNAIGSISILFASSIAGLIWSHYGSTVTLILSSFVSFSTFLYFAFFIKEN